MNKHIAWDFSAIDRIFGSYSTQKTTKTLCDKRVKIDSIDSDNPTCEKCINILDEEMKLVNEIIGEIENE